MADTPLSSYPIRTLTHLLGHDGSTTPLVGKMAVSGISGGATVLVSDTAPSTTTTPVNSLWWESDTGIMYILYDDTSSIQWVAVGESVSGDVLGPPSSTGDHIAVFDGNTGKLIKDGGVAIADIGGGSIAPLQLTDANTVEQYNGGTAQAFRVYNERTSGSNYERGVFDWTVASDVLTIGTQQSGAADRNIEIVSAGGQTTVKRDLAGASATNSVLMISDNSTIPDTAAQAQLIVRNNRTAGNGHASIAIDKGHTGDASLVSFMSVGVSKWDFGLIGTGLSFRDTTTYRTVLELSAGAPTWTILVQGDGMVSFWPLVAASAGGSASRALTLGGSNTGIYHGSGAPTVSAAQGSLYLRTDGSSTSTRMYVNTDGTTGWTAVTTAA